MPHLSHTLITRYRPRPKNSKRPKSLSFCNCCLIFGRTFWFLGYFSVSFSSNSYISNRENSDLPTRRTMFSTLKVQPLTLAFSIDKGLIKLNRSRTSSRGMRIPSATNMSFPSGGISRSNILHPTQPARRAEGERGLRFSILVSVKKNDGTKSKFCTFHWGVYCMTIRFGTLSLRIAAIIEEYAESIILCWFQVRPLLSWKARLQLGHKKSTARVLVGNCLNEFDGHAGQNRFCEAQFSVTTRAIWGELLYPAARLTFRSSFMI